MEHRHEHLPGDDLTPPELEILALLGSGRTPIEVAEQLGIRPSAINAHLRSVYRKTGTLNSVHAARLYGDRRPTRPEA